MKKIILLLSIILIGSNIQAQSKIGTIDTDYILNQMPQMEQVKKDLEAYQTELRADFETSISKFENLAKAYQEKRDSLSDLGRKEKEQELISLEKNIQGFQQKAGVLMQLRKNELTKPLYELINNAMLQVIEEQGYTQILHAGATGLAYSAAQSDITMQVLNKMGIEVIKTEEN